MKQTLKSFLGFALGIEAKPTKTAAAVTAKSGEGGSALDHGVVKLNTWNPKGGSETEFLTLGELCTGTIVFGGTGSGKTSGTAEYFSYHLLRYGFGGLVLCAKPEEASDWVNRAKAAGREKDLILFNTENTFRFNPLQFEADQFKNSAYGSTENLLQILKELCETDGKSGDDPYWPQSRDKLFTNTMDLMQLADIEISFSSLHFTIISFVNEEAVQTMLDQAVKRVATMSESRQKDYQMIENYFKNEWQLLPEKTRETVKSLATNAVEPFARGAIRELFSTTSTITPEALEEGKIIVVDIPAITIAAGKASAVVWKYMVQKWAERRPKNGDKTRPVFIFADECQYFATPRDAVFQSTARSTRVATVYLTQTIGSLNFFGNYHFRTYRDQLLGNLINKIFHQNTDTETNEWAANFIGKDLIVRTSRNTGGSQAEGNRGGTISSGRTVFEQYDFLFHPIGFQNLKIGGTSNELIISAILIAGARRQFHGQKFATILFKQGLLQRVATKNLP